MKRDSEERREEKNRELNKERYKIRASRRGIGLLHKRLRVLVIACVSI